MQSSLLALRCGLGVKYLATSQVCLLWNHQMHSGGLNVHHWSLFAPGELASPLLTQLIP